MDRPVRAVAVLAAVGALALSALPALASPTTAGSSLAGLLDNVSITDDATHAVGALDTVGRSLRADALAAAGFGPGAAVTADGVGFTMPDVPAGRPDNLLTTPHPTTVKVKGHGNALAFLGTAGSAAGLNVTVTYTDKSSADLWVGVPAYTASTRDPLQLSTVATTVAGRNTPTAADTDLDQTYAIFVIGVNIDPAKTVRRVALSSTAKAHLYDLRVVTRSTPFLVDSVLGRTPQPDSCDPRVSGEQACEGKNTTTYHLADTSAHLTYYPKSGVVPAGASAFYNEITVQKSVPASYFMTAGYSGGYYGIQQHEDGSKVAIFSIFGPDKGTVADDELGSQVLYRIDKGDFVIHGEYAGSPSIRIPFNWKIGQTYATMITDQPDTTPGSHAQIVTAWLNTSPVQRSPHWIKLMTVRTERPAATDVGLSGLYSFIEDYLRDGSFTSGRQRTAEFGNAAVFTAAGGWQPLSRIAFDAQLSGRFTIQNDAYPTRHNACTITETVIGGDTSRSPTPGVRRERSGGPIGAADDRPGCRWIRWHRCIPERPSSNRRPSHGSRLRCRESSSR